MIKKRDRSIRNETRDKKASSNQPIRSVCEGVCECKCESRQGWV